MELTVDQALQQGVAAHKEGKLQDAEQLYRAILQTQPKHSDANHNLGVLVVAAGKPLEAIPLFKLALEANPQIEQFWLSYADALIKAERFDEAKRVLVEGEKSGVSSEKLDVISQQLQGAMPNHKSKIAKGQTLSDKRKKLAEKKKSKKRKTQAPSSTAGPSQDRINRLVEHYQAGRFDEVKPLAMSLIQQFPKHPFGWKVLGAVLKQMGRLGESLAPMQSAVKLSPQDAEAHSNLGATLQELGRLDEAESIYRQAIALKPDYAEAHYNLGVTLKELGRLDEAEASYREAITLKPDYAEAHSNFGVTLQELGRLDEAEASYRQAIALKPDYAEAHYNLGFTLQKMGNLDWAAASYKQAIALKPDYAEAHSNFGVTLQALGRLDEAEASYRQAIALKPDYAEAHSNLGITLKELGRLNEAEASYTQAIDLKSGFTEAVMNKWQLLFDKKEFAAALRVLGLCDTQKSRACTLESLYALGRIDEIYKRIEMQAELDDGNLRVAALSSFISEREKKNTAHKFCPNPLALIHVSNLSSHLEDPNKFVKRVVEELSEVATIWEPDGKSTIKGFQTPPHINLFANPAEHMMQLKSIILNEIDTYYLKFQNEPCSFIQKWPSKKSLHGWHVMLKEQGFQSSHIHPDGWLSGVIYLKVVPPQKKAEGAIEFSLNGKNYSDLNSPRLLHQPSLGDVVLFPSSLHHGTIPFTTDIDRIIVSFDLMPQPVSSRVS
jgi:tetratricopeptide (TPR) repeat protein